MQMQSEFASKAQRFAPALHLAAPGALSSKRAQKRKPITGLKAWARNARPWRQAGLKTVVSSGSWAFEVSLWALAVFCWRGGD